MNLYARKILGWHLSDNLSTESVLLAIGKAKAQRQIDQPLSFIAIEAVNMFLRHILNKLQRKPLLGVIQEKAIRVITLVLNPFMH